MKTQLEIEIEKMMSGQLYDANYNDQLLPLLEATSEKCWEYNHLLRPSQVAEREALLRGLLGKTGKRFKINQPFYCDYGFNIEIGEDFFANFNLVILDEAKVKIGDHVYPFELFLFAGVAAALVFVPAVIVKKYDKANRGKLIAELGSENATATTENGVTPTQAAE